MASLDDQLAQVYRTADEASRILRRAGLDPADVDLTGKPKVFWFRILDEAWKRGKVGEIVECAAAEYPSLGEDLNREVAPFIERLKEGGGPIDSPAWPRGLRRLAIPAASLCVFGVLALAVLPRPEPTAQLWKELGKQEQLSISLTGQLNSLALDGRSALQAKTQEIDQLKESTRKLEESLKLLRERLNQGGFNAEERIRLERAEAALSNNRALIDYTNNRLEQALAAMNAAVDRYKTLQAAPGGEGLKDILGRSLLGLVAMQAAGDQKSQARATLVEAGKMLDDSPENREILAAAQEKLLGPPVSYAPNALCGIVVEPLEGSEGIRELWVPKVGETMGRPLEAAGKITAVEPGTYDLWCRTTGAGEFLLVSRLEVREGQLTRVRPGPLIGRILVEPMGRAGLPEPSEVVVIAAGVLEKGSWYHSFQHIKKLGVGVPIPAGNYDLLCKPASGEPFVVDKGIKVEAGRETRVSIGDKIAAFVVPKDRLGGVDFERILVLNAGTAVVAQQASAADQPMLVGVGRAYDIIVKQGSGNVTLKKAVTPKGGELMKVP